MQWALALFVLPIAVFVAAALLLGKQAPAVERIRSVAVWQEPLGNRVFDDAYLQTLARTVPDFSAATWQPITLPNSIELGASVDLPPDGAKTRVWFKISLPPKWTDAAANHGRLGLMGNRVMGGPWAVYANGQLVQANLADWRMQWNTPLRVMLNPIPAPAPAPAVPAGMPGTPSTPGTSLAPTEIFIAVPYPQEKGYAMGSLFVGTADAIDQAWQERNFWQADAPRAASLVGLLLMLTSAQLALGRRKEPVFVYAINRRTVLALNTAERHQTELQQQLAAQKARLATQHAAMQRLEIKNRLATQHDALMQDLHDGLGSNLTSALLQARGGTLTPNETVLLLQELTDELRNLSQSTPLDQRSVNEALAELRQRTQQRLTSGGIQLVWAVDPMLPPLANASPIAAQHLRALLSEAIANVIKHAHASQICVTADRQGDAVVIEIADNGCGFDPVGCETGRGLPGMRQRAQAMGARLDIVSEPCAGTRWVLALPVGAAPAENGVLPLPPG